jgi:predicted Zn-dependent protease
LLNTIVQTATSEANMIISNFKRRFHTLICNHPCANVAWIFVLITCIFAAAGCETNPATGKSQLLLVGDDQLETMGAQAAPMLVQEYGGVVQSQTVRQYVNRVGQQVAQQVEPEYSDVDWQFITLESDVINAFALPGGRVFISRGMLENLTSEAQLAAVLGHEIGHVTAKHIDERMSQATAIDAGLGVAGGLTESGLAVEAAKLFGQGYLLKFGRDQELEADRLGLRYMMQAGYDPHAMIDVVNVLIRSSQSGRPPEFLSTHPDPERRLEQVQKLLNQPPFNTVRGNPQYQAYPERYHQNVTRQLGAPSSGMR